jgi:hypothetical protein
MSYAPLIRAMVRLDLLYSDRLHVLRSSRAMVRLDLLYSDRLQVLRSSRAMVRLDLLYGDRLDVLRSSRAMVRLDLLYSDRLHVLRSSAVDVPLCVLHCCEGVVLPMFLWRNKSSTPYSNPVSIKPDALDMDSWRGIPGRRGPHPCGNSTEWILEQGWFPPRSWCSRPYEGKAERLQTILNVYPLLSMFFQYDIGWYKGVMYNITWTNLNLFHRQIKLLCDSVQETKSSICRSIST